MSTQRLSLAAQLSNRDLLARVKSLAGREREATADLIAHLTVLDERGLYLAEGCSSLFTYCLQVLHLSEHAAYGRIEAARAARTFPIILDLLADGSVTLTTVGLLGPHLTEENHRALLDEARHQHKRQVEEIVARQRPQPPVPSTIRRLPTLSRSAVPEPELTPATGTAAQDPQMGDRSDHRSAGDETRAAESALTLAGINRMPAGAAPQPARPAVVEPIAPERYKVQFTATAETHAKLRLAQDLLRHQIPNGDLAQVMDRALTALLHELAKQKYAATERPVEPPARDAGKRRQAASRSRHIPAEVKRAVWVRDGGRCAFVSREGRRCTERGFLEFHHVVPYGVSGDATVENIELRCRAHNGYEAEVAFGRRGSPKHMDESRLVREAALVGAWTTRRPFSPAEDSGDHAAGNSVWTELDRSTGALGSG